jgi:hypothetical protein
MRQNTFHAPFSAVAMIFLFLSGNAAAQLNRVQVGRPDRIDAAIIKAGLRTAEPEDQGFVERVMANVDRGEVPRDLVESTFLWARQKDSDRKFQYFKHALVERARRMGITEVDAPPEDRSPGRKNGASQRFTGLLGRFFSAFSLESLRSRF